MFFSSHAPHDSKKTVETMSYFAIRGGSRKKIAKNKIPNVPTSKNV